MPNSAWDAIVDIYFVDCDCVGFMSRKKIKFCVYLNFANIEMILPQSRSPNAQPNYVAANVYKIGRITQDILVPLTFFIWMAMYRGMVLQTRC